MDGAFEVQLESLRNAHRKSSKLDGLASTLNIVILMIAVGCIAVGYALSNLSREQLAEWLGQPATTIERPAPSRSLGESVSRISKTWIDLVS